MQALVHYRDLGAFGGLFEAAAPKVQPRLPPGFVVVETRPGVTEIEITALDYRDIDWLSPYRELAIAIPVRFGPPGAAAAQSSPSAITRAR